MKFLSLFVFSLLVLIFAIRAAGKTNIPRERMGVLSLSSRATDVNSVPSLLDQQTPRPPF